MSASERVQTLMTEAILASGKTQTRVAEAMPISQPGLARLLRRPGNPTIRMVERLLEACGYELHFKAVKKS